MERLQQFAAAVVAAVLAVLCMIVGILGLTVWKPAQEVVASVTPSQPFVITREGVLPLFGQSVKVTASAAQDEEIALVVGTPADIMGWIGTSAYTEIIGVEGGLTSLKTTDHDSTSAQAAQSGQSQSGQPQSGQAPQSDQATQSGAAQSGDASQSGQASLAVDGAQSDHNIAKEIVSNDMWSREVSGKGTVTLDLKDVGAGQAVLAATESGASAPTVTLTWAVKKSNVLAIVSWILAMLFAAAALFLAYRQWRLLNSRHERAERIAARENADITDTQAISLQEIADYAASNDKDEPVKEAAAEPVEPRISDAESDTVNETEEEAASFVEGASPDIDQATGSDDLDDSGTVAAVDSHVEENVSEADFRDPDHLEDTFDRSSQGDHEEVHNVDAQNEEEAYFGTYAEMVDSQVDASHDDEPPSHDIDAASGDGEPNDDGHHAPAAPHVQAASDVRVLTIGRHAANGGPIEVDPPETVPTDTGTIDLSSIRPGAAVLPSRRALREARERGLERLVIDGREFDTGLLPIVKRDGGIAADEAGVDASSSSSDREDTAGTHGGWTSLMSSWMTRKETSKEEE